MRRIIHWWGWRSSSFSRLPSSAVKTRCVDNRMRWRYYWWWSRAYMPVILSPCCSPLQVVYSQLMYVIVKFSSYTFSISIAAISHRTSRNSANHPLAIDMWGSSVVLRCQCECLRARYEFCSRNIVCHFRGLLQCNLLFIQWWVYHLWWMQ